MSSSGDTSWRERLHTVIFEADTPAGKRFDVALLWVVPLCLFRVQCAWCPARWRVWPAYEPSLGWELRLLELVFTGLFTVEYILRLLSVKRPLKYAFSFYGLVETTSSLSIFAHVCGDPVAGWRGRKPSELCACCGCFGSSGC